MIYILIFFISLILTIFSLPYVITYLKRLDIIDRPDNRKIHTEPIPRMGGVVIFIVTFLTLICFVPDLNNLRLILISTSILFVCGIVDDRRGLNWKQKIVVQTAAAITVVALLAPEFDTVGFFTLHIPYPWSYVLLTLFIVGAVNAVNLLDGMDGLVTGYALTVFFMVFWLAYTSHNYFLSIMCAALLGSTLGFLKYNAFPARIFLGDSGSLVLGMFIVLAALLITPGYHTGRTISLTFPIIMLGLPVIDTLKVIAIRLWNRKSPFLPDKNHFHHVLMSNNFSHKNIVFLLQLISIGFILLAYYYISGSREIAILIFFFLALLIMFMKPLLKWIPFGKQLKHVFERELEKVPGVYIHSFIKFLVPFSIFFAALLVTFLIPGHTGIPDTTLMILAASCTSLFLISHFFFLKNGKYSETYVLINLLIFSAVASLSSPLVTLFSFAPPVSWFIVRFSILFLFLFVVFFLLTRERLFTNPPVFLSGIDLVMLVMIFLMAIVQNVIKHQGIEFPGIHLIFGYSIYMWYKIIVNWKRDLLVPMFYFSFALPIASLLIMMIM